MTGVPIPPPTEPLLETDKHMSSIWYRYFAGLLNSISTALGLVVPSVDNTVPRFDGVGGAMQLSGVTIDDDDIITADGFQAYRPSIGTGTQSSNAYNYLRFFGDELDASSATFLSDLLVHGTFGGSGVKGGRYGVNVVLDHNAGATSAANSVRFYVAQVAQMIARSADGGTDALTDPKGAYFALNPYVIATTGATALYELAGMEMNVEAQVGSSVHYKTGISIVSTDADQVQGVGVDAMISLSGMVGSVGWTDGILLSAANGYRPLAATGSVIRSFGSATIANGIDLSSYTISGYLLKGPNTGLNGAGSIFYMNGADAGMELGSVAGANTPYIDFHSSGNNIDYDVRLLTSGGTGSAGNGDFIIYSASVIPDSNDGAILGAASFRWSDLFLADGGVVDLGASGSRATITHTAASDSITIAADPDNATASSAVNLSVDNTNQLVLTGSAATLTQALTLTAGQIVFPASQNASANANTLDDYEEGTWTPAYGGASGSMGSVTYDFQTGLYTKIGNTVTCHAILRTDALAVNTAAGQLRVTGLPFAASSGTGYQGGTVSFASGFAGEEPLSVLAVNGQTYLEVYYRNAVDGDTQASDIADLTTGSSADKNFTILSITYFV